MSVFYRNVVYRYTAPGGRAIGYVLRQPSWISRAALIVFSLIILIPVVALLLIAILAALLVFGTLALINAAANSLRAVLGGGRREEIDFSVRQTTTEAGRVNVRVLGPADEA